MVFLNVKSSLKQSARKVPKDEFFHDDKKKLCNLQVDSQSLHSFFQGCEKAFWEM